LRKNGLSDVVRKLYVLAMTQVSDYHEYSQGIAKQIPSQKCTLYVLDKSVYVTRSIYVTWTWRWVSM